MSIFKKRQNIKPEEYPVCREFIDAIHNSFWKVSEFSFTGDIQDFKVKLSEEERRTVQRAMLAISQIENNVKEFWGDIWKHIPKPEISSVWYTFAGNEVIHTEAYSELLEVLGLNWEFEKISSIPEIQDRIDYLNKIKDSEDFIEKLILFSIFIEHVSLFSQFYVIQSFTKEKNLLKNIDTVVEATSKEENVHWLFGIFLVNEIKKEVPFSKEKIESIKQFADKALKAETKVLDWIFKDWDLDFLKKDTVITFMKKRLQNSLQKIGIEYTVYTDEEVLKETEWFNLRLTVGQHSDLFNTRGTDYTKKSEPVSVDDLFW